MVAVLGMVMLLVMAAAVFAAEAPTAETMAYSHFWAQGDSEYSETARKIWPFGQQPAKREPQLSWEDRQEAAPFSYYEENRLSYSKCAI